MLIIKDITNDCIVTIVSDENYYLSYIKQYSLNMFTAMNNDTLGHDWHEDMVKQKLIGFEVIEYMVDILQQTPVSHFFGHVKESGEVVNQWNK